MTANEQTSYPALSPEIIFQKALPDITNQLWSPPEIVAGNGGNSSTEKPKRPGSKPFPDPPRNARTARNNMKLYALLVGINDYPDSVGKLTGCLKDVAAIRQYLVEEFGASSPPPRPSGGFFSTEIINALTGGNGNVETTSTVDGIEKVEVGKLVIRQLTDGQATRSNIIKAFQQIAAEVTGDDTVWFFFSGHGTQNPTAEAFASERELILENGERKILPPMVPSGKDQCLVLMADEESPRQFLADKELAKLIELVYTETRATTENRRPHIVVTIDSCNSGGSTKDPNFSSSVRPRLSGEFNPTLSRDDARLAGRIPDLSDYFGNYTEENLAIPSAPHILLSASHSFELALELEGGGVFTQALLKTIRKGNAGGHKLHYAQLYTVSRAEALKIQKAEPSILNPQHPQMATPGGFDPFECWLEGFPLGKRGRYLMHHDGSDWYVRCGAIHGLPTIPENEGQKIRLRIIPAFGDQSEYVPGFIEEVGAQLSKVSLSLEDGVNPSSMLPINGEQYMAEVSALPARPVYLFVHGFDPQVKRFIVHQDAIDASESDEELQTLRGWRILWDNLKAHNIFYTLDPEGVNGEPPVAEIRIEENGEVIVNNLVFGEHIVSLNRDSSDTNSESTNLAEGLDSSHDDFTTPFNLLLTKGAMNIAIMFRTIWLENPHSRISHLFRAKMETRDNRGDAFRESHDPGHITIEATDDHTHPQGHGISYNFMVHMDRVPQTLFFYVFIIKPNCEIELYNPGFEPIAFDPQNIDRPGFVLPMRDLFRLFGILPAEKRSTFHFKVLATTEEIDPSQLTQDGILGGRPFEDENPDKITKDWAAVSFSLTLEKELSPLTNS